MAVVSGPPAVLSSLEVTGSTVMALRSSEVTIYLPRGSKPVGELPRVFLVLPQASALPEKNNWWRMAVVPRPPEVLRSLEVTGSAVMALR